MRNLHAIGRFPLFMIAAWLLPCAASFGQGQDSNYLLGQGVHEYHSGKYVEAQHHLTAAIEGGSHDPRVYYFRGLSRLKLGRTADADADFLEGSKFELTFQGSPGEIGRSLQRVQSAARQKLELYRSRAREGKLPLQRPAQPQVAARPAAPRQRQIELLPSPTVEQTAKLQPPASAPRKPAPPQKALTSALPEARQTAKAQSPVSAPRKPAPPQKALTPALPEARQTAKAQPPASAPRKPAPPQKALTPALPEARQTAKAQPPASAPRKPAPPQKGLLPAPAEARQTAKLQAPVSAPRKPAPPQKALTPAMPEAAKTVQSQPQVTAPRAPIQLPKQPALALNGPAIVQPGQPAPVEAVVEKRRPRPPVHIDLVAAAPIAVAEQEAAEPIKAQPDESAAPLSSLFGFDLGQKLGDLAGGTLPGNMAYLRVSRSYLQQLVGEVFREQRPVNDCILGTIYRGTSETVGQTRILLIPDERQARVELRFSGQTCFSTSGCTGPVRLFSHGTTWFESCKSLSIDALGARFAAAVTGANTCFTTDNIATSLPRLRGRISVNTARRRAAQSHAQASSVISRHSERDIGHGFDAAMDKQLTDFREQAALRTATLPKEHPVIAYGMHFHTTADAVFAVLLGPGASEGKFVAAPRLDKSNPDIELHVHSALAFKAISDPEMRRLLQPLTASGLGGPATKTPTEASAANGRKPLDIYWSADRHWLTLIWNAPQSTANQPAAAQ
jgi:hypothetical protein